jgi:hypothetical protein
MKESEPRHMTPDLPPVIEVPDLPGAFHGPPDSGPSEKRRDRPGRGAGRNDPPPPGRASGVEGVVKVGMDGHDPVHADQFEDPHDLAGHAHQA